MEYTKRNLECRARGGNPSHQVSYSYLWLFKPTHRDSAVDINLPYGKLQQKIFKVPQKYLTSSHVVCLSQKSLTKIHFFDILLCLQVSYCRKSFYSRIKLWIQVNFVAQNMTSLLGHICLCIFMFQYDVNHIFKYDVKIYYNCKEFI